MSRDSERDDLLLEIGVEELPARYVDLGLESIGKGVARLLEVHGLCFEMIETYGTPRRLAFIVRNLAVMQPDRMEEVRGPARKAALDEDGAWTRAALGFAKTQGVTPDDLVIRCAPNGEYVYASKHMAGRPTAEVLAEELLEVITRIDWPKSMRWGTNEVRFLRPIRWLVTLFGDEVVPLSVAGVRSQAVTRGHRTLCPDPVPLHHARDYVETMRRAWVIADIGERKDMVAQQVAETAAATGLRADIDPDLLDEVTHLVEFPTAFLGSFDEAFLAIPSRAIVTTMRENQRYFPVYRDDGTLAPHFIGVRNGDAANLRQVIRGNEKVLSARLSDATFFYQEDQKRTPDGWRTRLEVMTYHDRLGSVLSREERIAKIAAEIAEKLSLKAEIIREIASASSLLKFDLATNMVNEFPELQGYMGKVYARLAGASHNVAQAVLDQYAPTLAGAPIGETVAGRVLAIADKIERLTGGFATEGAPTGSQDPYGLRRAATGIVRTIIEGDLPLSLDCLADMATRIMREHAAVQVNISEDVVKQVRDFMVGRLKAILQDRGISADVLDALISVHPYEALEVSGYAAAVEEAMQSGDLHTLVELARRVQNLLAKAEANPGLPDAARFETAVEGALYGVVAAVREEVRECLAQGRMDSALRALLRLLRPGKEFFETVMVMDERPDVRRNRLALLHAVRQTMLLVMDLNKIQPR